jgi:hypothetical protein
MLRLVTQVAGRRKGDYAFDERERLAASCASGADNNLFMPDAEIFHIERKSANSSHRKMTGRDRLCSPINGWRYVPWMFVAHITILRKQEII